MDYNGTTGNYAGMSDKLDHYIAMAEAFAVMSYQGVYLVNLDTGKFVFSSDYSLLCCGHPAEEMNGKGADYLYELMPDEEKALVGDLVNAIKTSYIGLSMDYKRRLTLLLNFHIRTERSVMVCHKLHFLDFDEAEEPHLLLGLVSPSVHGDKALVMAAIAGTDYVFNYNAGTQSWNPVPMVHFSQEELAMLRLTMQGHSVEQIAKLMFKSVDTIKFYRRQVFLKLNVKNISEAIAYATHFCLI